MKKITALLLTAVLLLTLAACNGGGGGGNNNNRDKFTFSKKDLEAVLAGTYKGGFAGLSSSEKRTVVNAGKDAGIDVVFESDGSVTFTDEANYKIVSWYADGTWGFGDIAVAATTTPYMTTSEITTPELTTPEITGPEITTPEITTPSITTPAQTDPPDDPFDPSLFDLYGVFYGDPDALNFDFGALTVEQQNALADYYWEYYDLGMLIEPNGEVVFLSADEDDELRWFPDGTWRYTDEDGEVTYIGARWPDDMFWFMQLLPRPELDITVYNASDDIFYVQFTEDATLDLLLAYVDQLRAAGFNNGEYLDSGIADGNEYLEFEAWHESDYYVCISLSYAFAYLMMSW